MLNYIFCVGDYDYSSDSDFGCCKFAIWINIDLVILDLVVTAFSF
jgi:hypothetical protein